MATVSFHHVGYVTTLAPGVSHHWKWNNAPSERVWAFSADPIPILIGVQPGASFRVEVTRVEYRKIYDGRDFEMEIHFWIKNTGTIQTDYAVHMAVIRA